jgi:hypothetical protein
MVAAKLTLQGRVSLETLTSPRVETKVPTSVATHPVTGRQPAIPLAPSNTCTVSTPDWKKVKCDQRGRSKLRKLKSKSREPQLLHEVR